MSSGTAVSSSGSARSRASPKLGRLLRYVAFAFEEAFCVIATRLWIIILWE